MADDDKETTKVFLRKSSLGPGVKGINLNSLRRILAKAQHRRAAKLTKPISQPAQPKAPKEADANYTCCFCPYQTVDEDNYRKHIASHIQNKALQCSQCSFSTDRIGNFNAHVRNIHRKKTPLKTPFSCPMCWFKCYHSEDVTEHNASTGHCMELSGVQHKCSLCNHVSSSMKQMAKHISTHSKEAVSCNACSRPWAKQINHEPQCPEITSPLAHAYEESLEEATKGSSFSCTLCDFQCAKLLFLVEHIKAHTQNASENLGHKSAKDMDLPFCCTMCRYRCDRPSRLAVHMKNHGPTSVYRCKDCGYESGNLAEFRAHRQGHTEKPTSSCFVCLAQFSDSETLQAHMTTHSKKLTYACTKCEYKCLTRARLIAHLKTHAKKTQVFFPCPLCPYKYSSSFSLRNHLKTHNPAGKSFECNLCDYKCFTSELLKVHKQTHSVGEKFRCEICYTSLPSEPALKAHVQEHATSAKYFKCPICPNRYKTKFRLEKHSQSHTTGPVVCQLCGETLQNLIARRNHMIRIHGEIPVEAPTQTSSDLQFGYVEENLSDETGSEEEEVHEELIQQEMEVE